jgi:hypothetical protein
MRHLQRLCAPPPAPLCATSSALCAASERRRRPTRGEVFGAGASCLEKVAVLLVRRGEEEGTGTRCFYPGRRAPTG